MFISLSPADRKSNESPLVTRFSNEKCWVSPGDKMMNGCFGSRFGRAMFAGTPRKDGKRKNFSDHTNIQPSTSAARRGLNNPLLTVASIVFPG